MKLEFKVPPPRQPIPSKAKEVFAGEIFSVYQWEQQMFDGSTTTFEKLKRPNTIGVVPVTQKEKIVITEQEQPGMEQFYSLAGGRIDQGETVAEAAHRELREETGMEAAELVPWFALRPYDKIEWIIYVVIARGCWPVGELQLDAGEKISTLELSFTEFKQITRDPQFRELEIRLRLYQAEAEGSLDQVKALLFG